MIYPCLSTCRNKTFPCWDQFTTVGAKYETLIIRKWYVNVLAIGIRIVTSFSGIRNKLHLVGCSFRVLAPSEESPSTGYSICPASRCLTYPHHLRALPCHTEEYHDSLSFPQQVPFRSAIVGPSYRVQLGRESLLD